MEPNKKLKLAKIFGIVAAALLALMLAALEVVVVLTKTDVDSSVYVTWTTLIVFLWLFLAPVALGLSIAGTALSASARKAGEAGAKPIKALCIITLVTTCVGFLAYAVIYGALVGA